MFNFVMNGFDSTISVKCHSKKSLYPPRKDHKMQTDIHWSFITKGHKGLIWVSHCLSSIGICHINTSRDTFTIPYHVTGMVPVWHRPLAREKAYSNENTGMTTFLQLPVFIDYLPFFWFHLPQCYKLPASDVSEPKEPGRGGTDTGS